MNRVDKKIRSIMKVAYNTYVQAKYAGMLMHFTVSAAGERKKPEPIPGYRHNHTGNTSSLYSYCIELLSCNVSLTCNETVSALGVGNSYGVTINSKEIDTGLLDTVSE